MCVILIAPSQRPSPAAIEGAFNANRDGAGIAWRDKKKVYWRKGLDLKGIQELSARVPCPQILHFRIASVGPAIPVLTHPFVISHESPLLLSGETTGKLLFHNGHWGAWKERLFDFCIKSGIKLPEGKWSDSRAMAVCASILGIHWLDFMDNERIVTFGLDGGTEDDDGVDIFGLWHWIEEEQFWASNTFFRHRRGWVRTEGKKDEPSAADPTKSGDAKSEGAGGPSDSTFPRYPQNIYEERQGVSGGEAVKEEVEKGSFPLRSSNGGVEQKASSKAGPLTLADTRWLAKLNPKPFRSSGKPVIVVEDEYVDAGCEGCGQYVARQSKNIKWWCHACREKKNHPLHVEAPLGCDNCGKFADLRPAGYEEWTCAICIDGFKADADAVRQARASAARRGISRAIVI